MRVGAVGVAFMGFVFRGVIAVIVFLVMLVGFLRGERGARKSRQQQSRHKELPHTTNPNMISVAEKRTLVTQVPKEEPAGCSGAASAAQAA